MGFPAGHLEETRTIPLGARVRVDLERGAIEFREAAVE
jgi:muramoyltetrapeptide carboxypeptidase LdcA involved in peptidoglycan recycling